MPGLSDAATRRLYSVVVRPVPLPSAPAVYDRDGFHGVRAVPGNARAVARPRGLCEVVHSDAVLRRSDRKYHTPITAPRVAGLREPLHAVFCSVV